MLTPTEIRAARERLGLSQSALAHLMRVSRQAVWQWERGEAKPSEQAAMLLAILARHPELVDELEALSKAG